MQKILLAEENKQKTFKENFLKVDFILDRNCKDLNDFLKEDLMLRNFIFFKESSPILVPLACHIEQ